MGIDAPHNALPRRKSGKSGIKSVREIILKHSYNTTFLQDHWILPLQQPIDTSAELMVAK
jgi:hypothetical protein